MTIFCNIVANASSQIFAALLSFALVPATVRALGLEAYGLVGFFLLVQGFFVLLDFGLAPTIGREAARCKAGAISSLDLRRLLRSMEFVFFFLGIASAAALAIAAPSISQYWLKPDSLSRADVTTAIALLSSAVSLRWLSGLYRNLLAGFEHIVWLSGITVGSAMARFALVLPVMAITEKTVTVYFFWQLLVSAAELLILALVGYRVIPSDCSRARLNLDFRPLIQVSRFALNGAFASFIWVLITQTDKLILSGVLSLPDYAAFTLAVQLAAGITLLSSPIVQAVLPRLTALAAASDEDGLVRLYRDLTQLVVVIIAPFVVLLAFFAEPVLVAWTNDPALAQRAAPLVALYAIGNGILSIAGLPYCLQVARGNLDLHSAGNLLFVLAFFPLLLWLVDTRGATGAGIAWVIANALPLAIWTPVVHHRFFERMHLRWLAVDVASPITLPLALAGILTAVFPWPEHRWALAASLVCVWAFAQLLAFFGSTTIWREMVMGFKQRNRDPRR